eukprot:1156876-Pelagomonas_calceolata.AAC.7
MCPHAHVRFEACLGLKPFEAKIDPEYGRAVGDREWQRFRCYWQAEAHLSLAPTSRGSTTVAREVADTAAKGGLPEACLSTPSSPESLPEAGLDVGLGEGSRPAGARKQRYHG